MYYSTWGNNDECDCQCHTEESLKENDGKCVPAIDCCEHCDPEGYEDHHDPNNKSLLAKLIRKEVIIKDEDNKIISEG